MHTVCHCIPDNFELHVVIHDNQSHVLIIHSVCSMCCASDLFSHHVAVDHADRPVLYILTADWKMIYSCLCELLKDMLRSKIRSN